MKVEITSPYQYSPTPQHHYSDDDSGDPSIRRSPHPISAEDHDELAVKHAKPCTHYFCCICCPCLPMWTRWICCFLLFILIGLAIAAGVLASQFKQPQVSFNGVTNDPNGLPRFQKSDSNSLAFNINMGFQFSVENPNIEQLTFETIKAMAYYPTAPHQQIGGGELRDLHIDAYGTTNFTFPFHIQYDPAKDPQHAILMDIISKCGPSGGQDFVVNYDLVPTVRILGIPISLTLSRTAKFPCPFSDAELPLPTDVALVNAQQQPE